MVINKQYVAKASQILVDEIERRKISSVPDLERVIRSFRGVRGTPLNIDGDRVYLSFKKNRIEDGVFCLVAGYTSSANGGSIVEAQIDDRYDRSCVAVNCSETLEGYEPVETIGNKILQKKDLPSKDFSEVVLELKRLSELR